LRRGSRHLQVQELRHGEDVQLVDAKGARSFLFGRIPRVDRRIVT